MDQGYSNYNTDGEDGKVQSFSTDEKLKQTEEQDENEKMTDIESPESVEVVEEVEHVREVQEPDREKQEAQADASGQTTGTQGWAYTARETKKTWDNVPTYHVNPSAQSNLNGETYLSGRGPEKMKKKTNTGSKWVACICMALVFGILASVTFQAGNFVLGKVFKTGQEEQKIATTQTTQAANTSQNKQETISSIADIAENVMPSVVSITNLSVQQIQNFFWGVQEVPQQSSGSGIIIGQSSEELLIVTNNHVIENSTTLTVSFIDGESSEALIKGSDAKKDIAVVAVPMDKISQSTRDAIKVAVLGDSTTIRVGEETIAIGNALGYGQSVTNGIVSALNRQMEDIDVSLIQTNAAINPGNSGGALLNAKGEVIGINTAKIADSSVEGMGYAIPISEVSELIDTLMNREVRTEVPESERGYIGITGADFTANVAAFYNLPEGVFVKEVSEGSGAESAGLKVGNVITKIDGITVGSMSDLQEQLKYYRAGETVTLTIQKVNEDGQYVEKNIEVKLGKRQ